METSPRFRAIAFDYFVLFNPDSVVPEVERVFPGKGREFTNLSRTRQFEYSWLRSITNRYVDFLAITEDSLIYTVAAMKLELTPNNKHTPWKMQEFSGLCESRMKTKITVGEMERVAAATE